jgi:hypothetical protein
MKLKNNTKTVWIVQGFDSKERLQFMMVCSTKAYANKMARKNNKFLEKNDFLDCPKKLRYEIEDWAICGPELKEKI